MLIGFFFELRLNSKFEVGFAKDVYEGHGARMTSQHSQTELFDSVCSATSAVMTVCEVAKAGGGDFTVQ